MSKRKHVARTRFSLILPLLYFTAVVVIIALRNTPLNNCKPSGLAVVCFGNADIAYLFAVLPGVFAWSTVNGLTSFLFPFMRFDYITNALGIDGFYSFFLLSWFITLGMVFLVGQILDRRK